jgi:transposase
MAGSEEELSMSVKERDRLKVLDAVHKGHISQKQAAEELDVSTRWVRKLLRRVAEEGDRGVIHKLRGRASNRKTPEKVKQKAVSIFRQQKLARQWHDYGPTLAAEELAADYGIAVGKETLRKWLIEAGLWQARRVRLARVHQWRARRERLGELVQWDTSEHDWLEGRGAKLYLIAMIDDATSRVVARFVAHDSTEENLKLLRTYLETHGRPLAFYTDKASLFQTAPKAAHHRDAPPAQPTHIGRALQELNIEWIAAHSPQAKGRIERFFGTAQNRLLKGLRKAKAATLAEANRYLDQIYLPHWNQRFIVPAVQAADAHRPLGPLALDSILSCVQSRTVAQDHTIRLDGSLWQIPAEYVRSGLRGARVSIERRLDGSHWIRWRKQFLPLESCSRSWPLPTQPRPVPRQRQDRAEAHRRLIEGRNKWKASWTTQHNPPLWQAIQDANHRA